MKKRNVMITGVALILFIMVSTIKLVGREEKNDFYNEQVFWDAYVGSISMELLEVIRL